MASGCRDYGAGYARGMVIMSYDVQIRRRWYEFNEAKLHLTTEVKGARCSLVYFWVRHQSGPQSGHQISHIIDVARKTWYVIDNTRFAE